MAQSWEEYHFQTEGTIFIFTTILEKYISSVNISRSDW